MIVITGIGRCGTSLAGALCSGLGYDLGAGWGPGEEWGFEHPVAVEANNLIWDKLIYGRLVDLPEDLPARIGWIYSNFPIIKDPRLADARCLEYWYRINPNIKILLLHRNLFDMKASRLRCFGNEWIASNLAMQFNNLLTFILEKRIPYRLLLFPQFADRPWQLFQALEDLGLAFNWDQAEETWARLYNPEKIHFGKGAAK